MRGLARKRKRRNTAPDAPEFRACYRYAQISPRKVRLIVDLIRGLPVNEALTVLKVSKQRASSFVDKALKSAIANADHAVSEGLTDADFDIEELYVHDARADDGPRLGRFRPRARGMWYPYQRRYSHITIVLRPSPTAGE